MAKNIKRTVLSEKSPRNRHIAWAEPKGDSLQLNIFNNGKWRPIAGGGSGSSDSSGCGCNDFEIQLTGDNPNNINGANINKGNFQDVYSKITNGQLVNGKVFYKIESDTMVSCLLNEIQSIVAGINPNTNEPSIGITFKTGSVLWTEDSVVFNQPTVNPGGGGIAG